MRLPPEYLDLTLREVLLLAGTPAEGATVATLSRSLTALARDVAREDAERETREREWLAQQFDALEASPK